MSSKVIVENIRVPALAEDKEILHSAQRILKKNGIPHESDSLHLYKRSVDARHKDNITFVCSVIAETEADKIPSVPGVKLCIDDTEILVRGHEKMSARPYVVGFGPAGMFCALKLAENGMRPIVVERGSCVKDRIDTVERFYKTGVLDTETNIQFGAGGAGTFSDGKLVTRIGDRRTSYVLQKLCELGAPEDILWKAKPHVGTDILRSVVENAEKEIVRLGGEIRYNSRAEKISDGKIKVNGEWFDCGVTVLAPGHSSRDPYFSLLSDGYDIEVKPFSVGVRIEHLQRDIDRAMFGDETLSEKLGHAEYQLSYREGERGVYSFCMCPGGEVVAATSEEGGVVTNGMSYRSRTGKNANAAIAVSVLPSDFGNDPYGAIDFQRKLEKLAFEAGGSDYAAPCQSLGYFYLSKDGGYGDRIVPTYMNGKVAPADFNKLFPAFVSDLLKVGFSKFGRKINGFNTPDAPLTGIETRTSAPLRIMRSENFTALGHPFVYPCGEGAGYAGGITSAAVDGLRVAEAILERFI